MLVKKILDSIPAVAGIYLFKDQNNQVIYIGKAKSLKKRVHSYFQKQGKDWKIDALLSEYATVDYIETKNEEDALLLEAQLVNRHQPKFNVLLKSGQPFVYIVFTKEPIPKVRLVRNKEQKGVYFGPFLYKMRARGAYNYLMRTFRLEWCLHKIDQGCLKYHLNLCAGNCRPDFNVEDYIFRVRLAQHLLKGHYVKSLKKLKNQINLHNQQFAFEKAKHLHDYMRNLDTIFNTLKTKFSEERYANETFLATTPIHKKTAPDMDIGIELQKFLHLSKPIVSIDCFDVSHFQSNYIVGSCIRFVHGVPDKDHFRRFKIRTLKKQDDYAALQEIVTRRYKDTIDIPDLIVIDGGKGQLNAIKEILPDALIVALAKREERLFIDSISHSIILDGATSLGKLFIALRDYAHHFAISYHRVVRRKSFERNI